MHPAAKPEAVREIASRPLLVRLSSPSFFISPPATFRPCSTRSASTFDFFVPSVSRLSVPFPARSHCPSAFPFFSSRLFLLAAAADAQPVLHRQIDSVLRMSLVGF